MKKILILLIFLSTCLAGGGVKAANFNPTYPRIGIHMWQGPEALYAQFDMAVGGISPDKVHAINSDTIVGQSVDVNDGGGISNSKWITYYADGDTINIYGGGKKLYNITNECPDDPPGSGYRYNEAVAKKLSQFTSADFLMTAGLLLGPRGDALEQNNIDLDRDGEAESWSNVVNEWKDGVATFLDFLSINSNNKPFLWNGGDYHFKPEKFNGKYFEYGQPFITDWYSGMSQYNGHMTYNREPHIIYIDGGWLGWGGKNSQGREVTEFQAMRFGLATTLLGDGYFSYQMGGKEYFLKDHFFVGYFDEYDLDLGYPTSIVHQINKNGREGVFVRFFDNGVSMVNVLGESTYVSDAELRNLAGYNGPYYRFQGAQDSNWNNGEKFNQITLDGSYENVVAGRDDLKDYWGDAVILLKQPEIVIAPIIIDENSLVTTPGQKPTKLTGNFRYANGVTGNFWRMYPTKGESRTYAYSEKLQAKADFVPTINVAGKYKVYEWHGESETAEKQDNIKVEIHYARGIETKTIDQTKNFGEWNYIGEYYFDKGQNGFVRLENPADGKTLIADAVKFVYQTRELKVDLNCDERVNILDLSILLSNWNRVSGINDYLNNKCVDKTRNLDLSISGASRNRIDLLDISVLLSCWGKPTKDECYE